MADETFQVQRVQTPYELLIRWSDQGTLQGAHCMFLIRTINDTGLVLATEVGAPQPVAVASQAGFPLDGLMSDALVAALTQIDALNAQIAGLNEQLANSEVSPDP